MSIGLKKSIGLKIKKIKRKFKISHVRKFKKESGMTARTWTSGIAGRDASNPPPRLLRDLDE